MKNTSRFQAVTLCLTCAQRSFLKQSTLTSMVTNMTAIAARPAFQTMWRSDRTKILHEGFRQYMEHMMAEGRMSAVMVLRGDYALDD